MAKIMTVDHAKIHCSSFPPSVDGNATILILGSMPGGESLRRNEYYAYKQNVFWRIVEDIYRIDRHAPYEERLAALRAHAVALWDVLANCNRSGSLDSSIREARPNAIAELVAVSGRIQRICCNGGAAGRYLHRFFPDLPVEVIVLPSTSPAAAALSYEEKLRLWQAGLTF
ncbi:MAG: DNA-deoxyinosine glycosylase [Victivallaceae bacterium]|nr:DNA-deoxyinosine glycosylase [Victivallaceae bacterium]